MVLNAPSEIWGVLVILVAAVAALTVYGPGAGPVGGALAYVVSLLSGRLLFLAPILLAAVGVLVLIPATRAHAGRVAIGLALCCISLAGMVHLARANKPVTVALEKLQRAGGVVGALVAKPVSSVIGAARARLPRACGAGSCARRPGWSPSCAP
jgi:S-DNA-T family DNA segregation ATPase FtsK/SpoIIIE